MSVKGFFFQLMNKNIDSQSELILFWKEHLKWQTAKLKGIVYPEMKITPWFTHPQAILGVYDFFFETNTIVVIYKNVLALPSFIMAVNGVQDF